MKKVKTDNCTFKSNQTYDGFAIYIKGENLGTEFDFVETNFINNFNVETLSKFSNIIATEIGVLLLSRENIKKFNSFSNHINDDELDINEISCVDFYGNPTPSSKFSESILVKFTISDESTKSFDFSRSRGFSESIKFSKSNEFSETNYFSISKDFSNSNDST